MAVELEIVDGARADGWDAFVASAPGGSHVQTSRWARVKAASGWSAARVVARRDGTIAGGCQLLVRRLGAATLAYAPRAPLVAPGDTEAFDALLGTLHEAAGGRRLTYLKLQPPADRFDLGDELERRGFVASDLEAAPRATVLVDLAAEPDELLARMRSGARANVRKAERRGVVLRAGGPDDFPAFGELLAATARRQGFEPYPLAYFRTMWEEFGADGQAHLQLAERGDQLLSALLVVGCNDTAAFKIGGWIGTPGDVRPNELAHFGAMRWARERGYRWYDLEGFPPEIERAYARGKADVGPGDGVAWFKLGLGGEVRVLPGAYDRSPSRAVQPLIRLAAPRLGALRGTALRLLGRG